MGTVITTIALAAVLAMLYKSSNSQDIFDAVNHNDIARIKSLVSEDPSRLHQKGMLDRSLLHYAAANSDTVVIEFLLDNMIPVDPTSDYGNTPLFCAIRAGNTNNAACLIDHSADVTIRNDAGMTPISFAVSKNDTRMVELLIEHGVDITRQSPSGDTYLHAAAYEGREEMVALLLDKGIDPNKINNKGFTALDLASERGHTGTQKILETAGATRGAEQSQPTDYLPVVSAPGNGLSDPVTITIIYDNYPCEAHIESGWGFSCLIEGIAQDILFDTGTRSALFMRNLEELSIDPGMFDTVFLSHEHGDHTGGLFSLLEVNHSVRVIMHDSFSFNFVRGVEATGATVQMTRDPAELMPDVYTSGEMDSRMTEEHSLAINTTKGLVVIVGCSHPGIVDIVRKFRNTLNKEIYAVLGGFHLMNDSEDQVNDVITQLKGLGVQRCGASHCTGKDQIEMFRQAFGDNYIAMGAGQVISF